MIAWMQLAIKCTGVHERQLRLHLIVGKHGDVLDVEGLKYVTLEVFV